MNFSSTSLKSFSLLSLQVESLKPLMILNACVTETLNRLLADENQSGSLLNVLTPSQSQRLLQMFQESPEINRRLQTLSQINESDNLEEPKKQKLQPKNEGPKRGHITFEHGIFKKRKTDEKELIATEIKSEASTECEFNLIDPNQGLNQARKLDFIDASNKVLVPKQSKKVLKDAEKSQLETIAA